MPTGRSTGFHSRFYKRLQLGNRHGLAEVNQADRQHDIELGQILQAVFHRHLHLPQLPDDVDVLALAMAPGERAHARSMQLHEHIMRRMAEDDRWVFEAYPRLDFPPYLRKREQPH